MILPKKEIDNLCKRTSDNPKETLNNVHSSDNVSSFL